MLRSRIYFYTLGLFFGIATFVSSRVSAQKSEGETFFETELLDLFVKHNARLPLNASEATVEVSGVVGPDGLASSLKIASGANEILDKEALRLLGLYKGWKSVGANDEKPFTYMLRFSPGTNVSFNKEALQYEFYFDKRERKTDVAFEALHRVVIPADLYGIPVRGDIEISRRVNGNWVIVELGQVRYEERLLDETKEEYTAVKKKEVEIILNTNVFQTGLPRYRMTENGQPKYAESQEGRRVWYENGVLKCVSFRHEKLGIDILEWYPSGLLKSKVHVSKPGTSSDKMLAVYDSLGNSLLTDGKGYVKGVDADWGEGMVENGLKQGVWKGFDKEGKLEFEERYRKGVLERGVSYKDGAVFNYKESSVLPVFDGGLSALYSYLAKNIKYPDNAMQNNIKGRVLVDFVVGKNGEVTDVKTNSTLGYGLEEEALRVVRNMSGSWKPGEQRGQKVKIKYTIPVNFALAP